MRDSAQWDLISVNLRGPRLPRVTPPAPPRVTTSQSVSQLFHGPAPRSDPSPTSDHSLLLKGRLRCRPLSAVLTASCAQGSRPRGFLSGTQFWWNWSAPLVRRWYAACAGNRALAVTRLDDHFFQGLLWARRLNLGRGPSSPAPSPDTSPGRTKIKIIFGFSLDMTPRDRKI